MALPHRKTTGPEVHVGDEPALSSEARDQSRQRSAHRISFRWLVTTTLTGIAGGMLLVGALYTALDRQTNFAANAAQGGAGLIEERGALTKADRIFSSGETQSARHVIHDEAVRRIGAKEFIGIKPYLRITADLVPNVGEFREQIPAFDPIRLYAEAGASRNEGNEVDGRNGGDDSHGTVTVASYDLIDILQAEGPLPYDGDVEAFARVIAGFAPPDGVTVAATSGDAEFALADGDGEAVYDDSALFDLAALQGASQDIRLTVLEKPAMPVAFGEATRQTVTSQRGDTMTTLLMRHGATRAEAADIVRALGLDNSVIAEGVPVEIMTALDPVSGDRERPMHVSVSRSDGKQMSVALAYSGRYVPMSSAITGGGSGNAATGGPRANVYQSIYATGLKSGIPEDLVRAIVRIFFFDVDFQRKVSPGDSLEVFFADPNAEEFADEGPEVLYAAVTVRGETKRFYRFRTPDDGVVDYYDDSGRSAKKFLIRKPIKFGRFRSGFGMRRHPILGYRRMHKGVDWSAPRGTPILAAGNGVVVDAKWHSGYGRWIKIRHANGYETSYAHQSRFAKGIAKGARVRQGQVIGYVGSTGLSTGPHLHYEVTVNGRHVNPMRIRLPRGRSLDGRILAAFSQERSRIEALKEKPPVSTRLATVE